MADRGEVKLRQGKIDDLIAIYKNGYAGIVKTIEGSTTAGKIQKARTMAAIRDQLTQMGVDVDAWVRKEIPQYYLDGANHAVQDLKSLGVDLSGPKGLAAINKEAIKSLTDDTALAFAQGLTGIARNAEMILGDAVKQQLNFIIADGQLTGAARKTVASSVSQALRDQGLSAITDRAGKNWSFETYANMLVRTKAVESRNTGLANKMLQNGYDLVQVSDHGSSHPECADWEGQILSVTGNTPGYPTLGEAESAGLFHPNCQHSINVINPDIAEITKMYDNPYNYDDAGMDPDIEFEGPGAAGVKTDHIQVFHGGGSGSINTEGTDLFGNAFYVARDKSVAKEFGNDVAKTTLNIKPSQVLTIGSDAEYNALITAVLKEYGGSIDIQAAIPKYARSKGYLAIEGTPGYDKLAGIAVLDRNLLSK
jgi:hypothetical protein